jgi:hypothetical protein
MCISWTLKCLISLMHGVTMKITLFMFNKYCRAGQATDDNITHAHYVLDN